MTQKIGRNDPCPCGSGKKYKKCCMFKENIVSGEMFNEEALNEYQKMLDNWDENIGNPPSFMEYMGKPNLATANIHEMTNHFETQNALGNEISQDDINEFMNKKNNEPIDDFLGLSATQMKILLEGKIDDCTDIFELNKNLKAQSVMDAPAMKQCSFLLKKIAETDKGIKATTKGNLPVKLVKEFYETFIKENSLYDINPSSEDKVIEIQKAKYFLKDSGFIKLRNGRYSITLKGQKLLNNFDEVSVYLLMINYFIEEYNWLYGTGYHEALEFIQFSCFFSLYIIGTRAKEFIKGEELVQDFIKAFPQLSEMIGGKYPQMEIIHGFCYLFCENYAHYLGLVDMKKKKDFLSNNKSQYKITSLFKELFIWKV